MKWNTFDFQKKINTFDSYTHASLYHFKSFLQGTVPDVQESAVFFFFKSN